MLGALIAYTLLVIQAHISLPKENPQYLNNKYAFPMLYNQSKALSSQLV